MKLIRNIILIILGIVLLTALLPQNIYLLVSFSAILLAILPYNRRWNNSTYTLLLFSVFYSVMIVLSGQVQSWFLVISYLITPVAFFRLGQYLMFVFKDDDKRFRLLLFIAFCYLINVFILVLVDIREVGIVNVERVISSNQTQNSSLAATLYGLMLSFGIGSIAGCLSRNQPALIRILYAALFALSLLSVIHFVNRGGLIISLIALFVAIILMTKKQKNYILLFSILFLLCFFALNYSELISQDVITAYEYRNDVTGYGIMTAGGRIDRWSMYMKDLLTHPLGWSQNLYGHNLWLDLARAGGWLPLFPFLLVSFRVFRNTVYLMRFSKNPFTITLVVLNLSLIIASSLEPVIEGSMLFFSILILVWGMIDYLCYGGRTNIMTK